jgi:ketosteroid isomerase-like protein
MNTNIENEIQDIVDKETEAWNRKSLELLLSVFHPDMVWVWPPDCNGHDPLTWTSLLGKFDHARWSSVYKNLFSTFELIRNDRKTQKIFVTGQGDGAFAVVDIDTLWRSPAGEESHWFGRTCKTYVKTAAGWKMIAQAGALDYSNIK